MWLRDTTALRGVAGSNLKHEKTGALINSQ
jgi:hypothetical protein